MLWVYSCYSSSAVEQQYTRSVPCLESNACEHVRSCLLPDQSLATDAVQFCSAPSNDFYVFFAVNIIKRKPNQIYPNKILSKM